jgi:long-chain fatty acid transport protein
MIGKKATRKHLQIGFLLLFLGLAGPQKTEASFVESLGIGARAMGMGSAYTGVADDIFAIYYNPAGLAQLEKHAITIGYLYSNPTLHASSSSTPGFHAEALVPYHLKCPVVGLGFNLDKTFKGRSPLHIRLGVLNMIPDNFKSVYRAWDPPVTTPRWIHFGDYWDRVYLFGGLSLQADKIPWVAVGVGFQFIISGTNYLVPRSVQPGMVVPGLHLILRDLSGKADPNGNIDMDVNTTASPTAGIMLFPTGSLRMGYSFRNGLSLSLDPVTAIAFAQLGDTPLGLQVKLSLKFEMYQTPQEHTWGISYRFAEKLLLSAALSWFRWSAVTSISRGDPDPRWNDTLTPRLGIEYQPISPLALRFGYYFDPSPIPEQIHASNYIDNDRHVFSLGAGYAFRDPTRTIRFPLRLNLMVQYLKMFDRDTQKGRDPNGVPYWPTSFESSGDGISVSGDLTMNF